MHDAGHQVFYQEPHNLKLPNTDQTSRALVYSTD